MTSKFSVPDLGIPPILTGPPEGVEGYYQLERLERRVGGRTLARHSVEGSLWYRLLGLHWTAFSRTFHFDGPDHVRLAQSLRSELLGLGLASSKAALDLLLVGYYSPAYAVIRHMMESWCACRYVEKWPEKADAYYAPMSGQSEAPERPPVKNMLHRLKQHASDERDVQLFNRAYMSWQAMSNGSHPSGVGIVQTHGPAGDRGVIGATYHPALWADGIRHGLHAAFLLVHETGRLQRQGKEWEDEVARLGQRTVQLLTTRPYAP